MTYHTLEWHPSNRIGKKDKNCFKGCVPSDCLSRTKLVTCKVTASPVLVLPTVPEALCQKGCRVYGNAVSLKIVLVSNSLQTNPKDLKSQF